MKTKRYSTEQIIGILKEADAAMPVEEGFCRKYSVSDATMSTTGNRSMLA